MARIQTETGKCSTCANEGTTYFWTDEFQTCLACLTKAQGTLARIEAIVPVAAPIPGVPAVQGRPAFSAEPARPIPNGRAAPPQPPKPTFNPNDPVIKRFDSALARSREEHDGNILGTEVERIFNDIGLQRGMERPLAMFCEQKYKISPKEFISMAARFFSNKAFANGGDE